MISHAEACNVAMVILSEHGAMPCLRPVGLFYDKRGNPRKIGMNGEADVQGALPPRGRLCAIEVKIGLDTVKDHQKRWRDAFKRIGGLYILARWTARKDGADTIRAALREAGYPPIG